LSNNKNFYAQCLWVMAPHDPQTTTRKHWAQKFLMLQNFSKLVFVHNYIAV